MSQTIETDVVIVGAGPAGIFAVFELGLLDIKAHVIDILPRAGGQCSELIPRSQSMTSGESVHYRAKMTDNLLKQIEPSIPLFISTKWWRRCNRSAPRRSRRFG